MFTCTEHKGKQNLLKLAIDAIVDYINDKTGEEVVKGGEGIAERSERNSPLSAAMEEHR